MDKAVTQYKAKCEKLETDNRFVSLKNDRLLEQIMSKDVQDIVMNDCVDTCSPVTEDVI